VAWLALTSPSQAAILLGNFSISGIDTVTVTTTTIEWGDVLFADDGSPDSFSLLNGTTGTLADLDSAVQPVGMPFTLNDFLTNVLGWDFTLTFIQPGTGTPAGCLPGSMTPCTPSLGALVSPFTILNNGSGGSGVQMTVRGLVSDTTSDPPSPFVGIFTTQFADMTADEILAAFNAQGQIVSTHSATFVATTPISEPMTLLLVGSGLTMLRVLRRRS
jgi:hypothetical protein